MTDGDLRSALLALIRRYEQMADRVEATQPRSETDRAYCDGKARMLRFVAWDLEHLLGSR